MISTHHNDNSKIIIAPGLKFFKLQIAEVYIFNKNESALIIESKYTWIRRDTPWSWDLSL